MTDKLMGLTEMAEYFGISRQLANAWSKERIGFPEPVQRLRMGSVFRAVDVQAYAKRHALGPFA